MYESTEMVNCHYIAPPSKLNIGKMATELK